MKPIIRIANEHRSCGCCSNRNYDCSFPSSGKKVDVIFEIKIGTLVSALCPECMHSLAKEAAAETSYMEPNAVPCSSPADTDPIRIQVRDCNGRRSTLEFRTHDQVLRWADEDMLEDDEILVITQGNICLYSSLQADPTMALTPDDITGFFA